MNFDTTTIFISSLIGLLVSSLILYFVIKSAVRSALIESQQIFAVKQSNDELINSLEKQNTLLVSLLTDGNDNRMYALVKKGTGETKMVNAGDLVKFPLQEYEVTVFHKNVKSSIK